ncbi:hypothetical protein [Caballeronia sp. NCTM1]|uniref:hypothetical protein n=1 Tax=Caballeronia sp. NCTM1 TaxID=2921753 RepID=UPI0020285C91|nr:hypothetical protein [Caballeronia sp. NCTM1]
MLKSAKCPISGRPKAIDSGKEIAILAPLIAGLASPLADKLVTFVSNYLKKRAAEFSSSTTQQTSAYLFDDGSDLIGCLIYVNGQFSTAPTLDKIGDDALSEKEAYNAVGLSPNTSPNVYAEFWLQYIDPDHTALILVPGTIDFLTPLSRRTSSAGVKTLAFTVQVNAPAVDTSSLDLDKLKQGAKAAQPDAASSSAVPKDNTARKPEVGADQLAGFVILLGEVKVGSRLNKDALSGLRSQAQPLQLKPGRPVNFTFTEIETESGGDILLELGTFIEDNKDKISPVIASQIKKIAPEDNGANQK